MFGKIVSKFDPVAFLSNILAVILGIVITFSIQNISDAKKQRSNVKSALQLVRDELDGCRQDLNTVLQMMDLEAKGAAYILKNADNLKQCPQDSISLYGTAVITEMVLTLPSDALELLKTSSLFQTINDNSLSLKILRAYDQCQAQQQVFAHHESVKSDVFSKACKTDDVNLLNKDESYISISQIAKDKVGRTMLIRLMLNDAAASVHGSLKDIETAIDAINEYLEK